MLVASVADQAVIDPTIIMPPHAIIIGMPDCIIVIMRLQASMNIAVSMPAAGFISHIMPVAVMVQVISHIIIGMGIIPIICGIMPGMPIIGIMFMPPIWGIMFMPIGIIWFMPICGIIGICIIGICMAGFILFRSKFGRPPGLVDGAVTPRQCQTTMPMSIGATVSSARLAGRSQQRRPLLNLVNIPPS